MNLFRPLALTLEHFESIESVSFPLLKGIVKFVSVISNFHKALPLCTIEPRETYNDIAIRPGLQHMRIELAPFDWTEFRV